MECASELAWSWKDSDSDSSYKYAHLALKLSRNLNDKKVESYSLADLGNYYKRKENYSEAKEFYIKSLKIRQAQKDGHDIASIYNQLGLLFRQQELFDSAVVYFQKGLITIKNGEDQSLKMKILDGYGMSLFHLEDYPRALLFVSRSMKIANELSDTISIARSHQNLGVIHEHLGSSKLALWHYNQALKLFLAAAIFNGVVEIRINIGSIHQLQGLTKLAIIDYRAAEKISRELGFEDNLSTIHFNLGGIYLEEDISQSIQYFSSASDNAKKNNKTELFLESQMGLLNCYILKKNEAKASVVLAKLKNQELIKEKHNLKYALLELQIKYYRMTGNIEEAFIKSQSLNRIQDSLFQQGIGNIETISLLEKSISEEKIAKEQLKSIKAEDTILRQKNKANRTSSIFLGILVIILILLIYFIRKSHISRMEKEKTIHQAAVRETNLKAEINNIVHQSEVKILEESLIIEKTTRESIGKDLHDQLGSKLAVVQILLESQQNEDESRDQSQDEKKVRASKLIEESCADLRSIAHNLVSNNILGLQLTSILDKLCNQFSHDTGLNVVFSSTGMSENIDLKLRKNVLAIVNLLMDNILRHSKAENVNIQLFFREEEICITVDDDGVGFESPEDSNTNGIGLMNAQERVKHFNGSIDIVSRLNKGTSITINFPRL